MKLTIFLLCTFLKVSLGGEPQVYETVDDQIQEESNTRIVRQPLGQPRGLYKPQVFHFEGATQQDPRKHRYAQQQKKDLQNILRNSQFEPLRMPLVQNWKVDDHVVASSAIEQEYQLPETEKTKVESSTKKPVTSRKLKPSSYYEEVGDKIKREDNNNIVYVNPGLIKPGYDFNALNSLVGQNPSHQLEGLKRLLENPSGLVLSPIKSATHHPITENVDDIPNPNTHPNVNTNPSTHPSLASLQTTLDEAARVQVANALAEAQKQALAQVEAQHQAIAKAQEEARRKAMAAVALHNQGLKGVRVPHAFYPSEEVVNLYAPSHLHQNGEIVKAQKIKIAEGQGHESAGAYQQVLLENQKGVNNLQDDESEEHHQYAARYAFGYKIRDVKMGNEFGHEEKRDGGNAKGLYHVLLPDGRMQKVEYYADPSGYHAKVTYENLAHH